MHVLQEQIVRIRSYHSTKLLVRTIRELRELLTLVLQGHNTLKQMEIADERDQPHYID